MLGRRALVTGAASGIGEAVAAKLAAAGAAVHLLGSPRRPERVAEAAAAIADTRPVGSITWSTVDVADHDSVEGGVELAAAAMGGIDCVVTSAGISSATGADDGTPLYQLSRDQLGEMMAVNLRGTWSTIHHAGRHLERAAGEGEASVVTIGSVASKRPSHGAYSVSKCAVWMLTRVIAHQWAPAGVRANCVAPGSTDTPMLRQIAADSGDADAWLAGRAARIPLGRLGSVDDVAASVLFLAGPSSSYITGSLVHPDGGLVNINAGG